MGRKDKREREGEREVYVSLHLAGLVLKEVRAVFFISAGVVEFVPSHENAAFPFTVECSWELEKGRKTRNMKPQRAWFGWASLPIPLRSI